MLVTPVGEQRQQAADEFLYVAVEVIRQLRDGPFLRLPEGKLSTRKGRVVFLDDVLDRAKDEARKIIAEPPDIIVAPSPGASELPRSDTRTTSIVSM